ncbi:MAG TPA: hypothetical protein VG897_02060, partial [Terriglobales bacterium]|nr:hypothetical protein [Terriglobales bacterium]
MGNRGLVISTERSVRRILYVAYPLLPVSNESCGGAEQMLSILEHEMAARRYITTVAACSGSRASGAVFATGDEAKQPDSFEPRNAEHEARVLELIHRTSGSQPAFDLIHDKSGSFWRRADECNVPVLATLHLPRYFYPGDAFSNVPGNVYFNCVSESQRCTFDGVPNVLQTVANGIHVQEFPLKSQKE